MKFATLKVFCGTVVLIKIVDADRIYQLTNSKCCSAKKRLTGHYKKEREKGVDGKRIGVRVQLRQTCTV